MNIRDNKGINLISLTITIIILLVITGAMIYNTKNEISMKEINDLKNDIQVLDAKVDDYYLKYGELPELCSYCNSKSDFINLIYNKATSNGASLNKEVNEDDGKDYYVIDLEKLGGFTLNYGYDNEGEYFDIKEKDNGPSVTLKEGTSEPIQSQIYVINAKTHKIYFPHGIIVDNVMYYTF